MLKFTGLLFFFSLVITLLLIEPIEDTRTYYEETRSSGLTLSEKQAKEIDLIIQRCKEIYGEDIDGKIECYKQPH